MTPEYMIYAEQARRTTEEAERIAYADPVQFPHSARDVAMHGGLPQWAVQYGDARAAGQRLDVHGELHDGWALSLWQRQVPLVHLTVVLRPSFADSIAALPPEQQVPYLKRMILAAPFRPSHGAIRLEWGVEHGWHLHVVTTEVEATGIDPSASALIASTCVQGIPSFEVLRDALYYGSKRLYQTSTPIGVLSYMEQMLPIKAANGGALPSMVLTLGAG